MTWRWLERTGAFCSVLWESSSNIVHVIAGTIIIAIDGYVLLVVFYMCIFDLWEKTKYAGHGAVVLRSKVSCFFGTLFSHRCHSVLQLEKVNRNHLAQLLVPISEGKTLRSPYAMPTRLQASMLTSAMFMLITLGALCYVFVAVGMNAGKQLHFLRGKVDDVHGLINMADDGVQWLASRFVDVSQEYAVDNFADDVLEQDELVSLALGEDYADRYEDTLNQLSTISESLAEDTEDGELSLLEVYPALANATWAHELDTVDWAEFNEDLQQDGLLWWLNISTATNREIKAWLANGTVPSLITDRWNTVDEYVDKFAVNITREYIFDYHDKIHDWAVIGSRAVKTAFKILRLYFLSVAIASALSLAIMIWAVWKVQAAYKRMVLTFRRTGQITKDGQYSDVKLWDQSTARENETFNAPQALGFLGVFISNTVLCSALSMFALLAITFFVLVNISYGGSLPLGLVTELGMLAFATWLVDKFLYKFVADGTHITHRSCFDFWDFVQSFYKVIYGAFGALLRLAFIQASSIVGMFVLHTSALPVWLAFLDLGYTSFVSMMLLQEKHGNPTCKAATQLIASMNQTVYLNRDRIYHVGDLQTPVSLVSLLNTTSRNASESHDELLKHKMLNGSPVNRHEDMRLTVRAWRQVQVLWVLTGNPSLKMWSVEQQGKHPISASMKSQLGSAWSHPELSQSRAHKVELAMPDVLNEEQLGHLRTSFALLDKDEDGIVGLEDLRYHFQEHGVFITAEQASEIIAEVSVYDKGFFRQTNNKSATFSPRHDLDVSPGSRCTDLASLFQRSPPAKSTTEKESSLRTGSILSSYGSAGRGRAVTGSPSWRHRRSGGDSIDREETCLEELRAEGFDFVEYVALLTWRLAEAEPGSLGVQVDNQESGGWQRKLTEEIALRFQQIDSRQDMVALLDKPFQFKDLSDLLHAVGFVRGVGHLEMWEAECVMRLLATGRASGRAPDSWDGLSEQTVVPVDRLKVSTPRMASFFEKSLFGGPGSASILLTCGSRLLEHIEQRARMRALNKLINSTRSGRRLDRRGSAGLVARRISATLARSGSVDNRDMGEGSMHATSQAMQDACELAQGSALQYELQQLTQENDKLVTQLIQKRKGKGALMAAAHTLVGSPRHLRRGFAEQRDPVADEADHQDRRGSTSLVARALRLRSGTMCDPPDALGSLTVTGGDARTSTRGSTTGPTRARGSTEALVTTAGNARRSTALRPVSMVTQVATKQLSPFDGEVEL